MTEKEQKEQVIVEDEPVVEKIPEPDMGTDSESVDPVDELIDERKKKEKLAGMDREIIMYSLATDVSNLRVNQAEVEAYSETVQEMGDNNDRMCEDGVRRKTQYYVEKYYQFLWHSKYQQIQLNRRMIEQGITVDELNAFMDAKLNVKKE